MPTREAESQATLGSAAKEVAEHASTIARLELELASLELKRKVAAIGVGVGLLVGAAALGFYAIGFLFATITAALATFLPVWLSLLIVTLVLLAVAGILAWLGIRSVGRGTPPVPQQAIDEAKLTTQALKGNGSSG
ncbi:MAG TPA: phage holin family protein [Gaiellaceae bacterium]|nr:phage holin family protein [Gaiellaceae bacterium]